MNTSIKSKINKFGKAGNIVLTVLIILVIAALVLTGIGAAALTVFKDGISFDVTSNVAVKISDEIFGGKLSEEEIQEALLDGTTLNVNNSEFDMSDANIEKTDDGCLVTTKPHVSHYNLSYFIWILLLGMVHAALILAALFAARRIMNEFKVCDSPFTETIAKKIKNFAIFLIPLVFTSSALDSLENSISSASDISITIDLGMVALVIVVFVLSKIFDYGAQLQTQADETF